MALTKISTAMWNSVPHHDTHDFNVDDVLYVDVSANKVGIGTTLPANRLEVASSVANVANFRSTAAQSLVFIGDTTSTTSYSLLMFNSNSGTGQIWKTGTGYSDWGGTGSLNIYNSAGAIALHPNGTANAMFLSTGGNVGIGTTSPSAKLHVEGSSIIANSTAINPDSYTNKVVAGAIAQASSWGLTSAIGGNGGTGDSWAIGTNGSYLYMGYGDQANTNSLQTFLQVLGRNVSLVPDNGNVGIGTTSPSATLHTNVTGNNTVFRFTRDTGTNGRLDLDFDGANANFNTIYDYTFQTNETERVRIHSGGDVSFRDTSANEAFYWDASAAILGIGTNNPSIYSSKLYLKKSQSGTSLSDTSVLRVENNGSGYTSSIIITDGLTNDGFLSYKGSNQTLGIGVGASTALNINTSGNVGIGTSSPTTGKLVVHNGDIEVRDSTGNSGGRIKAYDDHHAIYFREGGSNQINYYEYGDNVSSGGGHRFFTGGLKSNQTLKLQIGDDYTQINNSARTPIFYDSDDTGYYVDPASTSRLNEIYADDVTTTQRQASPRWDTAFYVLQAQHWYGDTSSQAMYLGESGNDVYIRGQLAIGGTDIQSGYALTMSGSIDMNANSIDYISQLHFNDNVRFYDDNNDNYLNFKWGDTANGGIKFIDGGNSLQGYIYASGNGDFGLLDGAGSWKIKLNTSNVEMYGSQYLTNIYANVFYDRDNTGYYVDPSSTGAISSIKTAGGGQIGTSTAHKLTVAGNGNYMNINFDQIWNAGGNLHLQYSSGYNVDMCAGGGYAWSRTSLRAPIFYDSNNTGYYLNPNGYSQLNRINADGLSAYQTVIAPYGGDYTTSSSTQTGAIKVTLPHSWTNTMLRMTIKVYQYSTNQSFEVHCGGYNYAPGSTWVNPFAYIIANPGVDKNFNVRFGHDGSKCCIYIGETNSTWSYMQIVVTDVKLGYSYYAASDWDSGWDVGFATSFGAITQTLSNSQVGRIADVIYDSTNTAYYLDPSSTGDSLRVAGDIVAYYSSDRRLKDNIIKIDSALDKVNAIGGYTFDWNEEAHKQTGSKDVGVIAQEVEEIFPEIVQTRSNGYKAVNYEKLVPLLIEAIKELSEKVKILENK